MNMWQEGSVLPIEEVNISNGLVHGTCPILVEGNEYIFRIKAVNKSSKGHWNYSIPSEPSDSMIAKIRYSKFKNVTAAHIFNRNPVISSESFYPSTWHVRH